MKRRKPRRADAAVWSRFEIYADSVGIGKAKGDWEMWWDCWKSAYDQALTDAYT